MKFSRPEYWNRKPIPSPADLPDPGIEPGSPALQADSLPAELLAKPLNMQMSECKSLSRVQLSVTPWTIQSMEFSRPEYWSG